jgi:hypothetical protein
VGLVPADYVQAKHRKQAVLFVSPVAHVFRHEICLQALIGPSDTY